MDTNMVAAMAQRDIEKLFFDTVMVAPIEALVYAGWLKPDTIRNEQVRLFWEGFISEAAPNMTLEQVTGVATSKALENKLDPFGFIDHDTHRLGRPMEVAQELLKRAQNASIAARLGVVAKAVANNDHGVIRQTVKEMASLVTDYAGYQAPTSTETHLEFVDALEKDGGALDTFIPNLDQAIGGLENGTEIVIGARPSVGSPGQAVAQTKPGL